ncbi:MAG: BCAM0308 family protein [Alphaproteobacteria bacterium]
MKQHVSKRTPRHQRRTDGRSQDTHIGDTYKMQQKLPEPCVCSACGAVFHEGRWTWKMRPTQAVGVTCQACLRIKDKYPAGELTLKGAFAVAHKDELLALARHNEALENKERPLNRIMGIESDGDTILITTTDIHLPRRIGEALSHAYHGRLAFKYDEDGYFVRVHWEREK